MPAGEYIRRRRRVLAWMETAQMRLAELDAFVTPTIPITAPPVAAVQALDDYRRHNTAASRNSAILSLLDYCAVTLPVGRDAAGIPVGMQIAATRGAEPALIGLCVAIERRLGTPRARLGLPPMVAS
jgi:aspartyl-tRNA(Asn)/glutamyl-tRNA(Gln) amidotransferase subunit A